MSDAAVLCVPGCFPGAEAGRYGWGWRHVQVGLLFLALTMAYVFRINISICLVEMTDKNSTSGHKVTHSLLWQAPTEPKVGTPPHSHVLLDQSRGPSACGAEGRQRAALAVAIWRGGGG